MEEVQDDLSTELIAPFWDYVFDKKEQGVSNKEICNGLRERGLDEPHSSLMINILEVKASEKLEALNKAILRGGFFFVLGLIMIYFTTYTNGITEIIYYIVMNLSIIRGAILFFYGVSNIGKYKTIIANTQVKSNNETETE
jgi:hypothetical protein